MLVNVGLRRIHFQPEPGELGIPFPLGKSYIGKSRSPLVPGNSGQWILANTHSIRRTRREQGGALFGEKEFVTPPPPPPQQQTQLWSKNLGRSKSTGFAPDPWVPCPSCPGQAFSKFLLLLGSFLLPRLGGDRWRSNPPAIGDKQKVCHS